MSDIMDSEKIQEDLAQKTQEETDTVPESTTEASRIRTLTERGMEAYTEKKENFWQNIEKLWKCLDSICKTTKTPPEDIQDILSMEEEIVTKYEEYRSLCLTYLDFLKKTRSEESLRDFDSFINLEEIRKCKVETALEILRENRKAASVATRSVKIKKSKSQRSSRGSSAVTDVSSLVKKTRARAEAEKANLAYAEKQALILKQRAEMEQEAAQEAARKKAEMEQEAARIARKEAEFKAELELLESRKKAAAAEAEARALEYNESRDGDFDENLPNQTEDPLQRVQDFIDQHQSPVIAPEPVPVADNTNVNLHFPAMNTQPETAVAGLTPVQQLTGFQTSGFTPIYQGTPSYIPTSTALGLNTVPEVFEPNNTSLGLKATTLNKPATVQTSSIKHPLAVTAPEYIPHVNSINQDVNTAEGITRFLFRKDLLFNRLTNFNDRPETYYAWKASFKRTAKELQVSDSEELDLLVKLL